MFSAVGKMLVQVYRVKRGYFEGDWSCSSIKPNTAFQKNNSVWFWFPLVNTLCGQNVEMLDVKMAVGIETTGLSTLQM